jgi:hypothetical protein
LLYLGSATVAIGAFDVGDTLLSAGTQALRADGRLAHLAYVLCVQGIVTTRLAKWDVAIPAAEEARRLATELGQPLWTAAADTIVSTIAGMRGDEGAAERASAEAERIALPTGANQIVALAQFGRVSAAIGASRHDDAYEAAERLFDPTDSAHHPAMASWIIGDLGLRRGPLAVPARPAPACSRPMATPPAPERSRAAKRACRFMRDAHFPVRRPVRNAQQS